jgi:succinate dehydrogenase / fumarate reductase membrane anchor subunit
MRYLTARKRAEGKGAAHAGTEHHWSMTLSARSAWPSWCRFWLYVFGKAAWADPRRGAGDLLAIRSRRS